jgi:hypothetical protein
MKWSHLDYNYLKTYLGWMQRVSFLELYLHITYEYVFGLLGLVAVSPTHSIT